MTDELMKEVSIADALRLLRDSISLTAANGLENDRALLTLGTALTERINLMQEQIDSLERRYMELVYAYNQSNERLNMLLEIYNTHFNDDAQETKH